MQLAVVAIIVGVVFIAGCAKYDWWAAKGRAERDGTYVKEYEWYLRHYPNSHYSEEARAALEVAKSGKNYVLLPKEKFCLGKTQLTWSDFGNVIYIVPYEQIEFKILENRFIGVRKIQSDNNAQYSKEIICYCDLIKDSNIKGSPDEYIIQNERCRISIVNGAITIDKLISPQ